MSDIMYVLKIFNVFYWLLFCFITVQCWCTECQATSYDSMAIVSREYFALKSRDTTKPRVDPFVAKQMLIV